MKKYLNGPSLICALVAFTLFVATACAAYYWTAGVFVTAQIALLYVVLGALGALALLFRRVWFSFFFYIGCLLGWASGRFIGGLEGAFAPTAGLICTFFLIAVCAVIGVALEWKRFQFHRKKEKARREQRRQEDEERERRLLAKQTAKVAPAGQERASTPASENKEES